MQQNFSAISGFSFLIFNLLCAPCFAAIGAIKREMNSAKWTWFAIGYQCGFAYAVSLIVYQLGSAIQGNINPIGLAAAVVLLAFFGFMLFRPYKESNKLTQKIKVK
jgi:ferrous iron transport protein B